jgi:hypothetical protein
VAIWLGGKEGLDGMPTIMVNMHFSNKQVVLRFFKSFHCHVLKR